MGPPVTSLRRGVGLDRTCGRETFATDPPAAQDTEADPLSLLSVDLSGA